MNRISFQKLTYKLVSRLFVFPIYKFLFKGYLIGAEKIPLKDSFIVVSNHGSLMDPPFLGHALGRNISFMAKSELFNIPILGFIIKACGAYPVKRGITDKNTIKTACEKLSNNSIIGIFIDGTRQDNGRVNRPKKGAALLAYKNKKLLLPVAIINSHRLVKFKFCIPIFTKIIIKVGHPIDPPLSSSKDDLANKTDSLKEAINKMLG